MTAPVPGPVEPAEPVASLDDGFPAQSQSQAQSQDLPDEARATYALILHSGPVPVTSQLPGLQQLFEHETQVPKRSAIHGGISSMQLCGRMMQGASRARCYLTRR